MRYIIIASSFIILGLVSCKHNQGPTNDYKNAKEHPSDREGKTRAKMTKKAEKDARKRLKKARKKHGLKQ